MQALSLPALSRPDAVVLCLGAHCDDIELGCGGTLLRLCEARPELSLHWVILSAQAERAAESRASARSLLGEAAAPQLHLHDFRDGFLPYQGGAVKECLEGLKAEIQPDLIFTHHRHDRHQDHRLVAELSWNTWRDHLILEYEIPKYEGDLGQPNLYVPLRQAEVERKIKSLLESYPSQAGREWFDADTLRGLMRLRGVESRAPERHAEAFHASKCLLELP